MRKGVVDGTVEQYLGKSRRSSTRSQSSNSNRSSKRRRRWRGISSRDGMRGNSLRNLSKWRKAAGQVGRERGQRGGGKVVDGT